MSLAASLLLQGMLISDCQAGESPAKAAKEENFYAPLTGVHAPSSQALTALGKQLFFDARLSASGKMSCATCHDPAHAYAPANGRAVQLGGGKLQQQGIRATPSLRYVQAVPSFTEHFMDDEEGGGDQGPTGGHTWDGRADTVHDQAKLPLLSPFEMANADPQAVVDKVRHAGYENKLRGLFGDDVFARPERAFNAVLLALEVFQQSPADFYPYTSKYDAFLRGQVKLSAREARGLKLFNDEDKGNCASCHISAIKENGFPAFSDWGFIAIGVPRNRHIPANARADYYDLGLCGPERKDMAQRPEYCGAFRTPSLRNVATRKVFFHNGAFTRLEDVMDFYAQRDMQPQRWYGKDGKGKVVAYDDMPAKYQDNLNREPPFDRKPGQKPAYNKAEARDMIAFLKTLNDGYVVGGQGKK